MMMLGCFTAKKGHRQTVKQYTKHPEVLANDCASFFPSRDSTHIETRFIPGEPVVSYDTLVFTDTVLNTINKTVTKTVRIHDTIYKDKVVFQEDQRKLIAKDGVIRTKDDEIDVLKEGNAKKTTQRNISLWANGLLGLFVVGMFVVKRMRTF